MLVVRHSYRGQ